MERQGEKVIVAISKAHRQLLVGLVKNHVNHLDGKARSARKLIGDLETAGVESIDGVTEFYVGDFVVVKPATIADAARGFETQEKSPGSGGGKTDRLIEICTNGNLNTKAFGKPVFGVFTDGVRRYLGRMKGFALSKVNPENVAVIEFDSRVRQCVVDNLRAYGVLDWSIDVPKNLVITTTPSAVWVGEVEDVTGDGGV